MLEKSTFVIHFKNFSLMAVISDYLECDFKDFFVNGVRVSEKEYFDTYHDVMDAINFNYRLYCRYFMDHLFRVHYSRNLYTFAR